MASVTGHTERVFDACYFGDRLITCGIKHIRFWTLLGNTLQFKEGHFGKSDHQTLLCIGYFPNADGKTVDDETICFTGAINGDLYVWKKEKLDRIISAHKVNVHL